MFKVLIFGAGAVGCTYGYVLHKAGTEVTAVCRSNYEAVKDQGILIRSKLFGRCQFHPRAFNSTEAASSHGPFDYVLVASKALPGTAEKIQDVVTPNHTAIVIAQNGIDVEGDYATLYPDNTIISGVVYLPVLQVEPGVVEMGPLERFDIGTYPAKASESAKAQTKTLSDLFAAGGATARVHDDVQPSRWSKAAVNGAWNSICALSLCDDANFLRSSPMSEDMVVRVMREVGRVATAAGYPTAITDETIAADFQRPRDRLKTGGKEPSMVADVRAHRPIEVEAIMGNIMRAARKHHLETPYMDLLYTLAKARNYEIVRDENWKPVARHD